MRGNFVYRKLGLQIASKRKLLAKSQEALAFEAQIDRTLLARIECGRANPTVKTLHKIARSMRVPIRELF